MKLPVPPPSREAEKRLLRVLAEIALEVGRERVDDETRCALTVEKKEACDERRSSCACRNGAEGGLP